jgi:hypothetical protein
MTERKRESTVLNLIQLQIIYLAYTDAIQLQVVLELSTLTQGSPSSQYMKNE